MDTLGQAFVERLPLSSKCTSKVYYAYWCFDLKSVVELV